MITRLSLLHYRNHDLLTLSFSKSFVFIHGPNGIGKTNVLEPLSLLTPGKGLRKTSFSSIHNIQHQKNWKIQIQLLDNQIITMELDHTQKRVIKLNGHTISSFQSIQEQLSVFWLTPEHDRLFLSSPSKRREFLDRLCYTFYPQHLRTLLRYNHALKQRITILQEESDPSWLDAIESTIALLGMEIMKVRSNVLNNLIDHQTNEYISFDIFYQKDCMDTIKEDEYKKKLQLMRDVDKKKSSTNFGPHRDDWQMVFLPQKIMANQCSTGEQKMLLLALLLSYICCVSHQDLRFFLILLDDITAYLDVKRYAQSIQLIHNLIEKQKNIPIQLFITSAKPIPTQINFLDTIEIINLEDYLEK